MLHLPAWIFFVSTIRDSPTLSVNEWFNYHHILLQDFVHEKNASACVMPLPSMQESLGLMHVLIPQRSMIVSWTWALVLLMLSQDWPASQTVCTLCLCLWIWHCSIVGRNTPSIHPNVYLHVNFDVHKHSNVTCIAGHFTWEVHVIL